MFQKGVVYKDVIEAIKLLNQLPWDLCRCGPY